MTNRNKIAMAFMAISLMSMVVMPASAGIETDMANFSLIIGNSSSGLTGFTVNMMGVFMTPPLLYFVVIGIFVTIVGIVGGLLLRRGKRR